MFKKLLINKTEILEENRNEEKWRYEHYIMQHILPVNYYYK